LPNENANARARKFVETTGAPRRLVDLELGTMDWSENPEVFEDLHELGKSLGVGDLKDVFVLLLGTFGVGKTRIATWLLRRAWDHLAPKSTSGLDFPRFFRVSDLAELRFRKHYGEDEDEDRREEARSALERCPLVVIDDVHRVAGYRGEEVFLEGVVEKRYDAELSTILTANELPREETRFADFLRYFRTYPIGGRSHRGLGL
jgi:DNA replication protein DnaC